MDRRQFISRSSLAVGGLALLPATLRAQDDAPPSLDSQLVSRFVGKSHFDFDAVREMLAQEPALINATWDWGAGDWETGLGAASHTGNRDIALFLLDNGARIDTFATTMLGYDKIVRTTVENLPTTVAVPGPHGIPLLSHAIAGREAALDVAAFLVERGADINAASNWGVTPLMEAARLGNQQILELLLERGADPTLEDRDGRTALAFAIEREHPAAAQALRRVAAAS